MRWVFISNFKGSMPMSAYKPLFGGKFAFVLRQHIPNLPI
jgi:hypothetical protein